jgi:hypothetical protein
MNPVRLTVIGAGPVGLEAALAAVERGFDVTVYEADLPGAHLRRVGWVRLFTPFGMNSTGRGRALLRGSGTALPGDGAVVTAGEFVECYVEPLSRLPVLAGRIRTRSRVTHVGREGTAKGQGIMAAGDRSRVGRPFLLRVETEGELPRFETADVVLDAGGVFATPRATGPGGLPALGEEHLGGRVDRHLPPILQSAAPRYAGRRVLLLGGGHSAATALLDFQALADRGEAAAVTWIHPEPPSRNAEPFPVAPGDPLPERAGLATRANAVARDAPWLTRHPGASVESYETWDGALRVMILERDRRPVDVEVDQVLALVGYRPDTEIHRELQAHLCYASEAPMNLASAILAASLADPAAAGDCLKQASHGAETLRHPEPGFYTVGAKSYGRNPQFLLALGHRQVEDVLSLVDADRGAARAAPAP